MLDSRSNSTRTAERLTQRADYTHKHNSDLGRHGWLRLTPAYSLKIVEELLAPAPASARVLDPFCGTGTTALCAAARGLDAVTTELNPFLVWFAGAKFASYTPKEIARAQAAASTAATACAHERGPLSSVPPLSNIERWWSTHALEFLRRLKGNIDAAGLDDRVRSLLLIAFCRTLIRMSNAAFNHQSMSFKNDAQLSMFSDPASEANGFRADVAFVLASAASNPPATPRVRQSDARDMTTAAEHGPFSLLITSPPYPNRMSYIRELRPYMYWLGFLEDHRAAGELDWEAIGGTWGAATSRLKGWNTSRTFGSRSFQRIIAKIRRGHLTNGELLANYVDKYFQDMHAHFKSLPAVLATGARVHYIVGNSTFYGVLLPVERLYADMLTDVGFKDVEIRAIRKRNSKKELIEFDVSAVWPN